MKNYLQLAVPFVLSFVSLNAFASTSLVRKTFSLRSVQGLNINIAAEVEESDANPFGYRNRHLKSMSVTASEFGSFRVVVVLSCEARHYPNVWSYQSDFQMDAFQSSGGAPFEARDNSTHQLEYAAGLDSDSCRTELSVVKDGLWQVDPINGTTHFEIDL
jgi:hypothetical protein